ncbi:uncharacterized protein LOC143547945 [Bidens hawaiensis]|uniref:uncharacterized protein LOC143547945 n=1 Tax=Bidens hawaiensis TaxID=980011 RepID=UPI0040493DE4
MASSICYMLLVLVIISSAAKSDIDIPYFDNLCDEVICGRGNCSTDLAKPFNFVCKCEPGWRRTLVSDLEDDLPFLPCVMPDCTIDYSCMPPPPKIPAIPDNISVFDTCYWTYCGEGTCNNKDATYMHTCDCKPGYTNVLNISYFPCFSDCAIGTDCGRLEVRSPDTTKTTPPGDDSQNDSSQGETAPSATSQGLTD